MRPSSLLSEAVIADTASNRIRRGRSPRLASLRWFEKTYDFVFGGDFQFLLNGSGMRVGRFPIVALAQQFVGGQSVRQSLARNFRIQITDVKVQMSLRRISGVPNQPKDLPTGDFVADLHAQGTTLPAGLESITATADIHDHMIAAEGFKGDRHSHLPGVGNILGD